MTDTELIAAVRDAAEQTQGGHENPAKVLMLVIATRLEDWMDGDVTARPEIGITGTGLGNSGGWFKERTPPVKFKGITVPMDEDTVVTNHSWDRDLPPGQILRTAPATIASWFKKKA